jgi:hypothetical protein
MMIMLYSELRKLSLLWICLKLRAFWLRRAASGGTQLLISQVCGTRLQLMNLQNYRILNTEVKFLRSTVTEGTAKIKTEYLGWHKQVKGNKHIKWQKGREKNVSEEGKTVWKGVEERYKKENQESMTGGNK